MSAGRGDSTSPAAAAPAQSRFVSAPDGLKLHVREWGSPGPGLPVLCLHGLARTSADFTELAEALSTDASNPRRVLAPDYRGRGLSDRDPDPARYTVPTEAADILAICDALELHRVLVVGTSRGGLIAMALSALRPTLLAGVVMNDVGPVLETAGLLRIRSYVGRLPAPRDWREAAELLAMTGRAHFPNTTAEAWQRHARRTWQQTESGGFELLYDPALQKGLAALDLEHPLPALWPLFDGLAGLPLMVIRGALSDLLSEETVAQMAARHPGLWTYTVADQGHAPFLVEPETIAAVRDFLDAAESSAR